MLNALECPEQSPRHTQKRPAEWDGLIAIASSIEEVMPPAEQQKVAHEVWEEVRSIPRETHEELVYYGIGVVTCSFMRGVNAKGNRAAFVANAANLLVDKYSLGCYFRGVEEDNKGLRLADISIGGLGLTVQTKEIKAEYKAMPLAQRLVINTLLVSRPSHEDNPIPPARHYNIKAVLADKIPLGVVAKNSLAGAMRITRQALIQQHEHNLGKPLTSEELIATPIAEIANKETIAALNLIRAGAITASLRLDEFRMDIPNIVKIDPSGKIYVDRSAIPKEPGRVCQPDPEAFMSRVLHEKRIGCPALYVTGAVSLAAHSAPQIVNAAQRKLLYR